MRSSTLSPTWVKNVYSLCVEGVVICGRSYTGWVQSLSLTITGSVKAPLHTQVITTFPPILYTAKNSPLTDTISQLSPLSTVPTIKKMKENKKGN